MVLLALGQKKMFKKPIPALLHLVVYAGFIIINVEILEILLDGVTGAHPATRVRIHRSTPLTDRRSDCAA
jgi:hypothetical protein